ncbi:hypothetical protein COCCADRAFT_10277 [Bipolaris zeicola 26-R-13]|uniref:Uncharacterized protein n=1 Tax=Cochliobolus carbonum (strain 26-R-13) TaxID=930089 RepID=W6XIS6_COCC2|nr:uncharacterized protein COCCADRAFT_10277 [Bipolaris zeicola 26-R-13]EUC26982.1 hypothetical protein COCCADRAFT_10277 [Bipolaris zeicola 26-R-13]
MHHPIGPDTQQARYHEGETATLDIVPHLVGNGDADILGLSLQRFTDFPVDTPFLDNAFHSCNLPPDFIVQEGLHDTVPTKTPDYNDPMSDIMFRACTTLDNDSTSIELSPENTSSVSEQPVVGGSNDVFLAHTAQSSPEQSGSQNNSGWQEDIEEDDLSHLLLQSASGFINYLGKSELYGALQSRFCGCQLLNLPLIRRLKSIPGTELGRKFISDVTGSTYFSDHITAFLENWSPSTPNISEHSTYDKSRLPSYEVAQSWIDAYFDSVQWYLESS